MSHQVIGYVRVSSQGQNTARQLSGIELDMEFVDKITGSTADREKLQQCIAYARKGDTVIVDSIDRLARNLRDLQDILTKLTTKGVIVKFVKENLVFTGNDDAMSTLMLQMMGAFAEFERTMIKSRQREGIDAAKKAGKHMGRPKKVTPELSLDVVRLSSEGKSIRAIAKEVDLGRSTVQRILGTKVSAQKTREVIW
ncbi:MAG TPA: recombinase family protein [Candidatus Brocadiaceae bacterium]